MLLSLPNLRPVFRKGKPSAGNYSASEPLQAHQQQNQIDHEEQYNRQLQQQHPAIVLVQFKDLIKAVEGLELFVHRAVPIREMEASGDILINPGEVPVAKKFCDIREFVTEASEVDADFLQLLEHVGPTA